MHHINHWPTAVDWPRKWLQTFRDAIARDKTKQKNDTKCLVE